MKQISHITLATILLLTACTKSENTSFLLADSRTAVDIFLDPQADSLISWAAFELAKDIESICGKKPDVKRGENPLNEKGIFIGRYGSPFMNESNTENTPDLTGLREAFHLGQSGDKLVICGSDSRAVVYGIFELTERLGVSPWQWWADVLPEKRESLSIELPENGLTEQPSVQYRGIFLNDEDWGLQPWAAKTFESEIGDIGPRTYEKIFQLLLRLKANTIWPAMHPSTKAFYTIEGNREMAAKYHMIIGTSHAEPMMRNNVDEWKRAERGSFDYFTNQQEVDAYWRERIVELNDPTNNFIVTMGMRGEHDSKMQGGSNDEERVRMMEQIIANQRAMLEEELGVPVTSIPQVLIPYKEVLDLYNLGMKVDDDITLMWTDDNYGYIRHFSTLEEQERSGGSGVYYHLSYWGRPHDYLWLSTTQPGLIWYEMSRAWQNGARKIWIANVGDIKPAEYTMEFFLDLAWNINSTDEHSIHTHLKQWAEREFGKKYADQIAALMSEYYRLAFLRKPEYMGWSQTEPTTATGPTGFGINSNKKELERRISDYRELEVSCEEMKNRFPAEKQDAFFQLIEYPVHGAANMNYKFLYYQLAQSASDIDLRSAYLQKSEAAFTRIQELTEEYNSGISGGKWNNIMQASPRKLPVFDMPIYGTDQVEMSVEESQSLLQPVFLNAKDYSRSFGTAGFHWIEVDGLGYSNASLTLHPFTSTRFADQWPELEYAFSLKQAGRYVIEVRCLPTHSNTLDQVLRISLDGKQVAEECISTRGRSEQWKLNVLRNAAIVKCEPEDLVSGKHVLNLGVNQSGMVIDQISIYHSDYPSFYEIPE